MATQWDTAQHAQAMPDAAVAAVVSRRRAARVAGDFELSDRIRAGLAVLGGARCCGWHRRALPNRWIACIATQPNSEVDNCLGLPQSSSLTKKAES